MKGTTLNFSKKCLDRGGHYSSGLRKPRIHISAQQSGHLKPGRFGESTIGGFAFNNS